MATFDVTVTVAVAAAVFVTVVVVPGFGAVKVLVVKTGAAVLNDAAVVCNSRLCC